MSAVQAGIRAARGFGLVRSPAEVPESCILAEDGICCTLTEETGGRIPGFQSLRRAAAGSPHGVPPGWRIIGTHVSPRAARRGGGAGAAGGLPRRGGAADSRRDHRPRQPEAPANYEAAGFRIWRTAPGRICKVFRRA